MKKLYIIPVFLLFLYAYFVVGCKKKPQGDTLPEYQYGTISGLKINDSLFSKAELILSVLARKSQNCSSDNYSLVIKQQTATQRYYEKIVIGDLSLAKKGTIQVSYSHNVCDSIPYAVFYMGDNDAMGASFHPLKNQKNTITISEYNKTTKEISGTFDITFLADFVTLDLRGIYPDTIRLHNCQFKAIVND